MSIKLIYHRIRLFVQIWFAKRRMRALTLAIWEVEDIYPCGHEMLCFLNPRYVALCREQKSLIEWCKVHDPNWPKQRSSDAPESK